MSPSHSRTSDSYSWFFTKSGNYSVKSGYWTARDLSRHTCDLLLQGPSVNPLLEQVWRTKASKKLQHFFWQCLSGCISTCQRLVSQHIGKDSGCPRCGAEEETINHLLFECPPARQTWALSPIPTSLTLFPTNSLFRNFDFLFWRAKDYGIKEEALRCYPWIIWYIWKTRNKDIFTKDKDFPHDIVESAVVEEKIWREAFIEEKKEEDMEVRLKMSSGLLELSTSGPNSSDTICFVDGAWVKTEDFSGIGWIVTREGIEILEGMQCIHKCLSPLHSEFQALCWAMRCLRDKAIVRVRFATDCKDLITMTSAPSEWSSFQAELSDFKDLSSHFISCCIFFIPRSGNSRADCLAECARNHGSIFSHVRSSASASLSLEESLV